MAYPPAGAQEGDLGEDRKSGKFKVVFKGSPDVEDDKRTVTGTFDGKKVSGKIKVEGLCSVEQAVLGQALTRQGRAGLSVV